MRNLIVGTAHFGPVYAQKIDVFRATVGLETTCRKKWVYAYSTNAAKTCKAAVLSANQREPGVTFKARFAK